MTPFQVIRMGELVSQHFNSEQALGKALLDLRPGHSVFCREFFPDSYRNLDLVHLCSGVHHISV